MLEDTCIFWFIKENQKFTQFVNYCGNVERALTFTVALKCSLSKFDENVNCFVRMLEFCVIDTLEVAIELQKGLLAHFSFLIFDQLADLFVKAVSTI